MRIHNKAVPYMMAEACDKNNTLEDYLNDVGGTVPEFYLPGDISWVDDAKLVWYAIDYFLNIQDEKSEV